ncbi:hypothetical protein Niako_6035 [Niastella koreensis GR20-10]|uniref:Uncharacterized protein n=1 Tax=Niastella koreensis (strain DSM 17620 / KACC 11465 / NBRC 106392 / GR20-10) TaxID=700598 RepID=G8T7K6_NIAKG|nr:hypothetical protein Niako_6035 [Niastella koreensis GR20-10]
MFNEPPYAERHVRWCERTVREVIPYFLLDNFATGAGLPGNRSLVTSNVILPSPTNSNVFRGNHLGRS